MEGGGGDGHDLTLCWVSVIQGKAFSGAAVPPWDILVPPQGCLCTGGGEKRLDHPYHQLPSSFSSTSCSPFGNTSPIAASLLALNLPSTLLPLRHLNPALPKELVQSVRSLHTTAPSSICLAGGRRKKTRDTNVPQLFCCGRPSEGTSTTRTPCPAPCGANVTAVPTLLITESLARLKQGRRSALSPDLNLMLAEILL